jgi:peptidoglycan/xylan/chitin deacetylase (PgdA/CDA1 family)
VAHAANETTEKCDSECVAQCSTSICGWTIMNLVFRIEVYCHKKIAQRLSCKRVRHVPALPIVSFTFDDFPRSALTVGGAILAEKGLRGTYYTSMGLMGQRSSQGQMYNAEDLQTLVEGGHELACHTFSHLYCPRAERSEVQRECERNRRAVAEALGGYRLRNFSFPSGGVTWSAKTTVTSIYDSCRTVEHGVNRNPVDLGFLRANPVYSSRPMGELHRLVEENVEQAGWLIFYTHDVSHRHSTVGCTPEYFRDVLRSAVASGASIMTVAEAVSRFQADAQ